MCGLTGFVDFKKLTPTKVLEEMVQTLHHRGPDDQGVEEYSVEYGTVGFGHTRLAILDLSMSGHQPMHFGNLSILLNGEIYNFREIREELIKLNFEFKSETDTEVVLKAFAKWGKDCVHRFIGMFSFVVFDRSLNQVHLCRDRAGVKPLFYYWFEGLFLFGSELKAFHQHPRFQKELNFSSISLYLKHGYIPGPQTIFENCYKQDPGTWITLNLSSQDLKTEVYWNVSDLYKKPAVVVSYSQAIKELEELLVSACKFRMVSDVPVGVFLSGGYDSATVTALLQKETSEKINTFTIGFPDGKNEAPFANEIAKYLGTNHTEYNCTKKDALDIIPDLPYFYDEPCADISAIPTILVSKLAKNKVSVALSADGGDEVFGGYTGYKTLVEKLDSIKRMPQSKTFGALIKGFNKVLPNSQMPLKRKLAGVGSVIVAEDSEKLASLIEHTVSLPNQMIASCLLNFKNIPNKSIFSESFQELNDKRSTIFIYDYKISLRDMLLVKVDRATMSVSLEGREPLLDHRILEYAASLPYHFKNDGQTSKKILKDILHQYIPKELMDRPKVGFDLPIFKWLKNDLSFLVDDYLSEKKLKEAGVFNVDYIKNLVTRFKKGNLEFPDILWRLIQFQMWYERWM